MIPSLTLISPGFLRSVKPGEGWNPSSPCNFAILRLMTIKFGSGTSNMKSYDDVITMTYL